MGLLKREHQAIAQAEMSAVSGNDFRIEILELDLGG
jgi:hypothetical protein